jgi:hypothetical protein
MPDVIVKLCPGKSEQQKERFAAKGEQCDEHDVVGR